MAKSDGVKPAESAEKSLGEVVGDVFEKVALLIHEEVQLAKTEVQEKISKLVKGAAAAAAAGLFALLVLIYLMHALAWLLNDLLGTESEVWVGYLIVAGILLLMGMLAGLLALRWFKKGAPPTPELAIEEAKKTRVAIEEARH